MRAILTMTLNDLRIFFSQRGNLVGLVLLPILFTVGLGFAYGAGDGPESLIVDVIDEEKSAHSARFLDELRAANETFVLCPMDNDADDRCVLEGAPLTLERGQERVREGNRDALIVLPAGFGAALESVTRVQIDY